MLMWHIFEFLLHPFAAIILKHFAVCFSSVGDVGPSHPSLSGIQQIVTPSRKHTHFFSTEMFAFGGILKGCFRALWACDAILRWRNTWMEIAATATKTSTSTPDSGHALWQTVLACWIFLVGERCLSDFSSACDCRMCCVAQRAVFAHLI